VRSFEIGEQTLEKSGVADLNQDWLEAGIPNSEAGVFLTW
jgi:hypothetical protein